MKVIPWIAVIVAGMAIGGCRQGEPTPTFTKEPNPAATDSDALVMAAMLGDIDELKQLRGKGADLDRPAKGRDVTPLFAAIAAKQKPAVEWLLDAGASIDAATPKGVTPLMQAVQIQETEIATLLLDRGANVNARNSAGTSILIMAITNKQEALAQKLIEKGANVNVQTGNHRTTALMMASHHDLENIAQTLLTNKARTDLVDAFGKTAVDYAKSEKMKDILAKAASKTE